MADPRPAYLADESFREPHAGPPVRRGSRKREPSVQQIYRRAEAIRRARPRPPQGGEEEWTVPRSPSTFLF